MPTTMKAVTRDEKIEHIGDSILVLFEEIGLICNNEDIYSRNAGMEAFAMIPEIEGRLDIIKRMASEHMGYTHVK